MIINTQGYIYSILLLIGIGILYFLHYKPQFVVPQTYTIRRQKTINRIVTIIILIIPFQIHIPITQTQTIDTPNIQIVFDISLSMTANDIHPSRFHVAKDMVQSLVSSWDNVPVSIILFSGIPFVHIPFATHSQTIQAKRQTTHLGQFPLLPEFMGTAIGDALLLAIANIPDTEKTANNTILLITDGDTNIGYQESDIITILEKRNIKLYAIGIGQETDFLLGYDHANNPIRAIYNPVFLEQRTQPTGGKTRQIQNNNTIAEIIKDIQQTIDIQSYTQTIQTYIDINQRCIPLFLCRLVYSIIRRGRVLQKIK